MAYDNPLDELLTSPGMAGDVERDYAENPPMPLETPSDTNARIINQQQVQRQVQQNINRVKGRDLAAAQIPSYTNPQGDVQPVTDQTGTPITKYDKASNVGYDSAGSPVQIKHDEYGQPIVEDAFADTPTTVDPKTGAMYKIRKGLGWNYQGQDPDTTAAALELEKQKAVKDASTALGRQLSLDERQYHRDLTDFKAKQKALYGAVPSLETQQPGATVDDSHKAIDDHFNALYSAPEANEKAGWFGSGDYTPQATILRNQYDQQKAAAHKQLDDLSSLNDIIAARKSHIDQQTAMQQNLMQQRTDLALENARKAGVLPPEQTQQQPQQEQPPPTKEQLYSAQAFNDAKAGNKSYGVNSDNSIKLDDQRPLDSFTDAVRDGVLPNPSKEIWQALQDRQEAIEAAGSNPKIKAALYGLGRGAAFLAAAPAGAGIGGAALSETGIGAPLGAIVGGLITGSIGAWGYGKLAETFSKNSDLINSFVASQKLHPGYAALGEIGTFGAGLPRAAMRAVGGAVETAADAAARVSSIPGVTADAVRASEATARMAAQAGGTAAQATDAAFQASKYLDGIAKSYKSSGGGIASTINNLSERASIQMQSARDAGATATQAAMGAGATIARDVLTSAASMVAIDTVLKEGSKALGLSDEGQTWGGVGVAALLGAMAAGHGIENKGYSSEEVGDILLRGAAHFKTGAPFDQPADVGKIATDLGVNDAQRANRMAQPLTPEEIEIFQALGKKAAQMDMINNAGEKVIATARQSLKAGKTQGIASVDVSGEARPGGAAGGEPVSPNGRQPTPPQGTPPAAPEPPAPAPGTPQTPPSPEVEGTTAIQKAVMAGQMSHAEATQRLTELGLNGDDIVRAIGPAPATSVENNQVTPGAQGSTTEPPVAPGGDVTNKNNAVPIESTNEGSVRGPSGAGNEGTGSKVGQGNTQPQGSAGARGGSGGQSGGGSLGNTGGGSIGESAGGTPPATKAPEQGQTVDEAAHEAATSTQNNLPHPTEGQKEAGNYKKGKVRLGGMDISIENPAGSSRRPEWPPLTAHYGYVRGTEGNDGDHIDVFIKPGTPLDYKGPVFVINQQSKNGSFDEHKAVIGVNTEKEARELYASNYSKVPGIHSVAHFPTVDSFREWAKSTRAPKEVAKSGEQSITEEADQLQQRVTAEKAKVAAKTNGVIYQGESDGLYAFKDPETGGNFSLKSEEVSSENVGKKLADLRKSFAENEGKGVGEHTEDDIDKAIAEAHRQDRLERSSNANKKHAELTEATGGIKSGISKETWEEQNKELIENPERYHPVHEAENAKGLKIGDYVKVTGKHGENVGVISTFDPRDGRPLVKMAGTYGGFVPLDDVEKISRQEAMGFKQPAAPRTEQQEYTDKLAKAALKLHAKELEALGHPLEFDYAPTQTASGLAANSGTNRITVDLPKLAENVARLSKAKGAEWIKRAVAHEVIHIGTFAYAKESPENMRRLLALNQDKELMRRAGEVYGKTWENQNEFQRAAEAARMLLEGPENLTEASYKFLSDFLKWLREKLGNLSKDVKDVLKGIEEKLGRYQAEEAKPEKKPAPKKAPTPAPPQEKWTKIGVNSRGNDVYEDANGVRSYVENGIRVTQPVSMVPTREGIKTKADEPTGDFLTKEEKAAKNPAPKKEPAPAPKEKDKYDQAADILKSEFGDLFASEPSHFKNATIIPPGNIELGAANPLTAFHGTRHKVDRFSNDRIGEGEGAQVYGWGLYFAENKGTADFYRTAGEDVSKSPLKKAEIMEAMHGKEEARRLIQDQVENAQKHYDEARLNPDYGVMGKTRRQAIDELESYVRYEVAVRRIMDTPESRRDKTGNLYTVSMDAEPDELLDWDKPLSEQSEKVKSALAKFGITNPKQFGHWAYKEIAAEHSNDGDRGASRLLNENGVAGIRFLDQGSRFAKKGTSNYVMFDDSRIKITHENGKEVELGAAVPHESEDTYTETLPPERIAGAIGMAQKLAPIVKTPEDLAQALGRISDKAKGYSQSFWSFMKGIGAAGPYEPDWKSIYEAQAPKEEQPPESDKLTAQSRLSNDVAAALEKGPVSRNDLGKLAAKYEGLSLKEIDEAAEYGVVKRANDIVDQGKKAGKEPTAIFDELKELYDRQPNLTAKTSQSKINQAYSTPIPLGYLASHMASVTDQTTVLEPTAGNGSLLLEANPEKTTANEIDPTRQAALKAQGFKVTTQDATKSFGDKKYDRVVENPPFGVLKGENGEATMFALPGGGETREIDHAIVLNSLQNMADDGRASLIIGGSQAIKPNERRAHYATGDRAEFFKRLYAQYRVLDHFTINGDLYKKQGAGWPVDVILIAGKGASPIQLPNANPPRILNTWDEVKSELTKTDEDRIQAGQYNEERDRDEIGGSLSGIRNALGSRSGSSGKRPVSQSPGKPVTGAGSGKPVVASGEKPGTVASGSVEGATGGLTSGLGDEQAGGGAGLGGGLRVEKDPASPEEKPLFHKPYVPVSKGPSFGIETPANLEEPQRLALEEIEKRVGMPLADYVREKLGYKKGDDLGKHFSAEQVDAIASAIYNIEQKGALILGDMAGIGKGRVAAGILEYAKKEGMVPVFVTKNVPLYSAMLNDFNNIGRKVNPLYTNSSLDILHPVTQESIKTGDMNKMMEQIAKTGKLPPGYDVVFTTYDQIGKDYTKDQTAAERQAIMRRGSLPLPGKRTAALNALIAKGKTLLVMDESHLGAGESLQGRRLMAMLRHPNAQAYYSSATFAKRPDAMPLYFKTNLRLAADSPAKLMDVFNSGGVVMQQIASNMLAQDGQYIRRERSFNGVPFETRINTETEERDRRLANEYTRGLRTILDMSNRVKAAVKSLNDIMVRVGKKIEVPTIKMESADFASKIHNFVNQYLFAIKAEAAAQQAVQAIKEGHPTQDGTVKPHKVIVAVQNTMEQPIANLSEKGLPLEFGSLLQNTLESLRRIKTAKDTYIEIGRKPDPKFANHSDEDLIAELVQVVTTQGPEGPMQVGVVRPEVAMEIFRRLANDAFLDAEAELKQLDLGGMPLSPVDYIRQRAESEGIRTGEITGRGLGIDKNGEVYEREQADIDKKGQLATLNEFNNSDLHLMVVNQSGSTGISAHSDKTFKNQMPRMMIVAQPHLDINEFVQMLGRVFRSGQVELPRYQLLQTALPAELRPAAILGKKMTSLNANTTSNTDSEVTRGTKIVDIFNEYGDSAVWRYMADNPQFVRDLQFPKILDNKGNLAPISDLANDFEEDGKLARSVASYAGLLPVEEQERFWEDVVNRYTAHVNYLDQIGENKLRAAAADLNAETVSKKVFTKGRPGGKSVFDEPSYVEMVKVKPKTMPLEPGEVSAQAQEAATKRTGTIQQWRAQADQWIEQYLQKRKERSISDWSKMEPHERERLTNQKAEVYAQLSRLGDLVKIITNNGQKVGAIVGVDIDPDAPVTPSKVMFTVLNNTLKSTFKMPASQMGEKLLQMDPNEFEVQYNASREDKAHRVIMTGNLVAASAKLNGRGAVTLYTKSDGTVGTGILMPGDYNPNEVSRENVRNAQDAIRVMERGLPLSSDGGKVTVSKINGRYILTVPASKAAGGKYWQNQTILNTLRGKVMEQRGAEMRGEVSDLGELIGALDRMGSTLSYQPPQTGNQELGAASTENLKVGDKVLVYKKPGKIASIRGNKLTIALDEGGVIPANVANVTPIPEETPETRATSAATGLKGQPATAREQAGSFVQNAKEGATTTWQSAVAALKGAVSGAKNFFTGLKEVNDYWRAKGEWLGTGSPDDPRSTGRQKGDYEVREMQRAIERKFSPSVQEAITNYIQAGGDMEKLRERAALSKPPFKKGYEDAMNLSPEAKELATVMQKFFAEKGRQAQEAGVLEDFLENYVNQLWKNMAPSHAAQAAKNRNTGSAGRLNTRFENAFQRIHESYFEGEQKGLVPVTKKIGALAAIYAENFNRVVGNRAFIKLLANSINASDGRPATAISGYGRQVPGDENDALLINPRGKSEETSDYVRVEDPALRGWKHVYTNPETGEKTFVQGDLLVHPEFADDLRRTLGKSAIGNLPVLKQIRNLQFAVKQTLLSLSAFHFVQEGTHAVGHTINPFNLVHIDMKDPIHRALINAGLMISSYEARRDFMEGVAGGGLIDKIPIIGKLNSELNSFLFEDFIPRLKMTMAIHALERNLERYKDDIASGKITKEQIYWKTAQQANDAFGEQNYRLMGRSQTFQDILRLGLLAPDFLESRMRFAADAATKYGGEQRRALILLAATMFVTAKLVEKALTGDADMKHPFSVTYKNREYKMRSVPGDMIELFQDPRRFIYGRLSPIISRGIIEGLTGRDWRGQKRNFSEQLADLLKSPIPMAARGIVDKRNDIGPGEQLIGSLGGHIKRHSDITDARNLGRDYQVAQGKQNPDEAFPPSKYLSLKYALEDGDEKKARSAFNELATAQGRKQTMDGFKASLMRPFSGSAAGEDAFVKSLSPSQRVTYNRAVAKQQAMMTMLQRIAATSSAAEAPSKPATPRKHRLPMFTGF